MTKRNIALLLCLLMLAPTAAACSEKKDDSATTTAADGAVSTDAGETEVKDDLPEYSADGYKFKIALHQNQKSNSPQIAIEEDTGEALDSAIWKRDAIISERFNVTFEAIECADYNVTNEKIRTVVTSQDTDAIDMAMVHMVTGAGLVSSNYYYPINEMDYVNIEKPWWDSTVTNAFSVGGKLYMAAGDILPQTMLRTSCMVFNKTQFDNLNMEYPYQDAFDGTWTLDDLYDLTKDQTKDLNGDNRVVEKDDFYGLTQWHLDSPYSFYYGAGGTIMSKDEDDMPVLNMDVENNYNIYMKIYNVVIENQSNYHTDIGNYQMSYDTFLEGRALFCECAISHLCGESWRNMEQDYGILPIPKYDEKQEAYMGFVNGAASMLVVPSSISDTERSSIIIEGLAAEAYKTVTPALYEITAKTKNVRDIESTDMIDLVFRNRVFDFGYAFFYGNGITSFVDQLLMSKSTNVASTFQKNEKPLTKSLDKLLDKFAELG